MAKVLFPDLKPDVAALERNAKAVKDIPVGDVDEERISKVIDFLALSRDLVRRLDADYKTATKDIKAQLAPFDIERKTYKRVAEEAESIFHSVAMDYLRRYRTLPDRTRNGTLLSLVPKKSVKIEDAGAVPDEFLLPREQCIDHAKVLAMLESGAKVPGASIVEDIIFRTKLSEVLE